MDTTFKEKNHFLKLDSNFTSEAGLVRCKLMSWLSKNERIWLLNGDPAYDADSEYSPFKTKS